MSERPAYLLHFISGTLDKHDNCRYLSSLDINHTYWQISLEESTKKYTAFTIPGRGLFQFRRIPFGLHGAPATCLIDKVLEPGLEPYTLRIWTILATPNFESHISTLKEVLERLKTAELTLRRDKCVFGRSELKLLGYVINRHDLNVDPEKVSAIIELPVPRNAKKVRRIVDMMSFIPNFSMLISPLTQLTKKRAKFVWT